MGVVCLALAIHGRGATPVDTTTAFDEANRLYEQGRFGAAADAYESLLQAGQTTPAVYHNLGNARLKNGEIGRSIQAFLQAERLAPRDAGIQVNLQFARRSVKGAEESVVSWPRRLAGRLRGNEWAGLLAVSSWLFFLSLGLGEWRRELKNRIRPLLQVFAVCGLLSLGGFWIMRSAEARAVGVVVVKEAPVRFTPLEESPVAFTAIDGLELEILSHKAGATRQDGWVEVRDPAQRSGWMKQSQVGMVVEEPRKAPQPG